MKVVMRKITEINVARYNPRKISQKARRGLKESIKRFGIVDPLVINTRDKKNVLVGGHKRLEIIDELKIVDIPTVEVDLSEQEEKALNIALNSKAIAGEFDEDMLADLLAEIKEDDFETFENLNFGDLEIAKEEPEEDPDGDGEGEGDDHIGIGEKDKNINVKISFHPQLWVGARTEVLELMEQFKKKYDCKVQVTE